jgi:hypothetical protein
MVAENGTNKTGLNAFPMGEIYDGRCDGIGNLQISDIGF